MSAGRPPAEAGSGPYAPAVSYRRLGDVQPIVPVDTATLFAADAPVAASPIDAFIANTNTLNRIYLPYGQGAQAWVPELGSLIVLGYMSAVESYVRAMISGLVLVDETCRRLAAERPVSFVLASSGHDPRLLPEALLEGMAFSSPDEIKKGLEDLGGISRNRWTGEVEQAIREYRKLCQVRHCCVHRFGKLGSRNALSLGFDAHKRVIERPFAPAMSDVSGIADALQGFVKTLNNFVFREVLERTWRPDDPGGAWSWHYGRDRKRFSRYYTLFARTGVQPVAPPAEAIYRSFREAGMKATEGLARQGRRPRSLGTTP